MFKKIKRFLYSSIISIFLIFSFGSKNQCNAFIEFLFDHPLHLLQRFREFPADEVRYNIYPEEYVIFEEYYNIISYFLKLLCDLFYSYVGIAKWQCESKNNRIEKLGNKALESCIILSEDTGADLIVELLCVIRDLQIEMEPINGLMNEENVRDRMYNLHFWLQHILIPLLKSLFPRSFIVTNRIMHIPLPMVFNRRGADMWLILVMDILFTYIPSTNGQNQNQQNKALPINPYEIFNNGQHYMKTVSEFLTSRVDAYARHAITKFPCSDLFNFRRDKVKVQQISKFAVKKTTSIRDFKTSTNTNNDSFIAWVLEELLGLSQNYILPDGTFLYLNQKPFHKNILHWIIRDSYLNFLFKNIPNNSPFIPILDNSPISFPILSYDINSIPNTSIHDFFSLFNGKSPLIPNKNIFIPTNNYSSIPEGVFSVDLSNKLFIYDSYQNNWFRDNVLKPKGIDVKNIVNLPYPYIHDNPHIDCPLFELSFEFQNLDVKKLNLEDLLQDQLTFKTNEIVEDFFNYNIRSRFENLIQNTIPVSYQAQFIDIFSRNLNLDKFQKLCLKDSIISLDSLIIPEIIAKIPNETKSLIKGLDELRDGLVTFIKNQEKVQNYLFNLISEEFSYKINSIIEIQIQNINFQNQIKNFLFKNISAGQFLSVNSDQFESLIPKCSLDIMERQNLIKSLKICQANLQELVDVQIEYQSQVITPIGSCPTWGTSKDQKSASNPVSNPASNPSSSQTPNPSQNPALTENQNFILNFYRKNRMNNHDNPLSDCINLILCFFYDSLARHNLEDSDYIFFVNNSFNFTAVS